MVTKVKEIHLDTFIQILIKTTNVQYIFLFLFSISSLQQRIAKTKPLRKNLRKRKKSQGGGGGGQSDHLNILTQGVTPSPAPPSSPILVRSGHHDVS